LQGEARVAGQYLARLLRVEAVGCIPGQKPRCLVVGGETTVTLRGQGKGGRNQEVALAAVEELKDVHNAALVTLATDGEDGPTDACGAVVTGDTWQRASQAGMRASDYLEVNNSYVFFDRLGDLIRTGATGTNVNDLSFLFCF
jgi:hydroxypyruvate reductase